MRDNCHNCSRILQSSTIAEVSGMCDHCREVVVLERTPLANMEYRAKTGEILNEKPMATDAGRQVAIIQEMRTARHRSWWTRLARLLEERPQECDCDACVANWETYG